MMHSKPDGAQGAVGHGPRAAAALLCVILMMAGLAGAASAQPVERRLGLVIGNDAYVGGGLATSANDAGLIAQTLQASGFDVMGARDLDGDALRSTFRDFVDKVGEAGRDAVAFVYLAGHGVQLEGENYFVPIDARIERDVDVPLRALRISDYVRPLAALNAKAVIVVLDAARDAPFAKAGQPLAGGLALLEPSPGVLYAFNAAPGTIAQPASPPYGPYAQALAEMMREGGVPLNAVFDRVRLRVHDATSGAEVPWHASQVQAPFVFFERGDDAPPEVVLTAAETRRGRPIQAFDDAREAYLAALERDSLQGYLDFLRAYPGHPLAKRVQAIVAARREAITWRRACNADTPEAYWSYLDRYPNGPHAWDARRRLAYLTAPPEPPPRYTAFVYDIPPPPPDEIIYVRRPYIYFADPVWAFVTPPPPPIFFLPPPPPPLFFRPPPPPVYAYVLPVPLFVPVPIYVRPVRYIAPPPPTNVVFHSLHQRQGIAAPVGSVPGSPPPAGPAQKGGQPGAGVGAGVALGVGAAAVAGAGAAAVALPPSMQKRPGVPTLPQPGQAPVTKTGVPPTGPGTPAIKAPIGQPLPGAPKGVPLPPPGQVPLAKPGGQPGTPSTGVGVPQPKALTAPLPDGKAPAPIRGGPPGQPKTATGTPPAQTQPGTGAPQPKVLNAPPGSSPIVKGVPPPPRQERAKEDRAAVEGKLRADRERQLQKRQEDAAAQQRARQQNQMQDLQRQRQQQMEAQRQQMQAQRQQAAQAAAAARAQQAQAAAAARAQAEAQARARAQQSQQKKCGGPGLPPCR